MEKGALWAGFSFECIAMFDVTLWQQMWSGFSHFRVQQQTTEKKNEEEKLWIMMENPVKKECPSMPFGVHINYI